MARTNQKATHRTDSMANDAGARQQPNAPSLVPSFEQIAARAFEIFTARGGVHGQHDADWEQAERELRLGKQ